MARNLPGPACATCRAASRRCDRREPACGRCVSKGIKCGGYPEKYRFCGLASRGRWKNSRIPKIADEADDNDGSDHIGGSITSSTASATNPMSDVRDDELRPASSIPVSRISIPSVLNNQDSATGSNQGKASPGHSEIYRRQSLPGSHDNTGTQSTPSSTLDFQNGNEQSSCNTSTDLVSTDPLHTNSPATTETTDSSGWLKRGTDSRLCHLPAPTDFALMQDQVDTLLAHYDTAICPHQIQDFPNDAQNPYRSYILPLVYDNPGLLYAVLGLAANHLGRLQGNKYLSETTAGACRIQAMRSLSGAISKNFAETLDSATRDATFATIQILLLHDISESGISENGVHISGAVSICSQSWQDGEILSGKSKRSIFFLANLVWLDVIRAFSHPERLCFPPHVRQTLIELSDSKLEMVNGCPRDVMILIGDALDQAKTFSRHEITQDEHHRRVRAIIRKLYSWNSSRCTYPSEDPRWLDVAEAYRHCCILRALRLLDPLQPAEDDEIQESVVAILDAAANIPPDSSLLELMVTPLFMAGADALRPHSRHYILLRLFDIKGRSEMGNMVPQDLLRKVWEERSRRPTLLRENVPWMKYTHNAVSEAQHDYLII